MSVAKATIMIIKVGIKAVAHKGEHAIVRHGVRKMFAEEAKVVFESVNGGITDAIAVQYSEHENSNEVNRLTKTEQFCVGTLAETLVATLIVGTVTVASAPVVLFAGVVAIVIVGLNEEHINDVYAKFKQGGFEILSDLLDGKAFALSKNNDTIDIDEYTSGYALSKANARKRAEESTYRPPLSYKPIMGNYHSSRRVSENTQYRTQLERYFLKQPTITKAWEDALITRPVLPTRR